MIHRESVYNLSVKKGNSFGVVVFFVMMVFDFFDTLLSASVFVGFIRTWFDFLQRTTFSVYALFTCFLLLLRFNKTFYHYYSKKIKKFMVSR